MRAQKQFTILNATTANMSLFKAREWWSTTAGYEEFHDIGCLCVGNIDNSSSNIGMYLALGEAHFLMHSTCILYIQIKLSLEVTKEYCEFILHVLVPSRRLI